jgi:Na+-driven multidrug efflux pump
LLFILPPFFGLNGVWATMPAADLSSAVLTGVFLFFELRHLDHAHAQTKQQATPIVLDTD